MHAATKPASPDPKGTRRTRTSRRFPRPGLAAGVVVACRILAACDGGQTMLGPASDQARHIDVVWRVMLIVCGVMYVLVLGFLAWALVRASKRAEGAPGSGRTAAETVLERGLAFWIALIVAGLTGLTAVSFLVDRALAASAPEPLRLRVTAHQWWWAIEYPGDGPDALVRTANEIHLPVDRPAEIELRSEDVIHSFWVPNLAGKLDLIPGRDNRLAITPREQGTFRGQCAEFCGLQHARMALQVVVSPREEFDAWRAAQLAPASTPDTPRAQEGARVFRERGCPLCHTIAGADAFGVTGPDLTHLASRRTIAAGTLTNEPASLGAWIRNPQAAKPGAAMPAFDLPPAEQAALVDYLSQLR